MAVKRLTLELGSLKGSLGKEALIKAFHLLTLWAFRIQQVPMELLKGSSNKGLESRHFQSSGKNLKASSDS